MILIPANDVESNQALSKWPRDEVEGLAQLAVDGPSAGQVTLVVVKCNKYLTIYPTMFSISEPTRNKS